jgi:hypothetical protein
LRGRVPPNLKTATSNPDVSAPQLPQVELNVFAHHADNSLLGKGIGHTSDGIGAAMGAVVLPNGVRDGASVREWWLPETDIGPAIELRREMLVPGGRANERQS